MYKTIAELNNFIVLDKFIKYSEVNDHELYLIRLQQFRVILVKK